MTKIEFIKDHPSGRFKKGQIVEMPKGNIATWLQSGYIALPKDTGGNLGNVDSSTNVGENSSASSEKQLPYGVKKNKKRNKKNRKK